MNNKITLTVTLPESWAEVPIGAYGRMTQAAQELAKAGNLAERLTAYEDQARALAELIGMPAEHLLADARLTSSILADIGPWWHQLPEGDPASVIEHKGVKYPYTGLFHTLSGGQAEALADLMAQASGKPLLCAANLLAILYAPEPEPGKPLAFYAEQVEAAAEAFETLPVSVAWPALRNFFIDGGKLVAPIATFLAVAPAAKQALQVAEQALTLDSPGFCSNMLRSLTRRLIRRGLSQL